MMKPVRTIRVHHGLALWGRFSVGLDVDRDLSNENLDRNRGKHHRNRSQADQQVVGDCDSQNDKGGRESSQPLALANGGQCK